VSLDEGSVYYLDGEREDKGKNKGNLDEGVSEVSHDVKSKTASSTTQVDPFGVFTEETEVTEQEITEEVETSPPTSPGETSFINYM